jgi:hypothetical protein
LSTSDDLNRFAIYAPDRPLPTNQHGQPIPEPGATGAHTSLGVRTSRLRGERYVQAHEWDNQMQRVKDIDFTDHGRPWDHANPHEHPMTRTRGGLARGSERPLAANRDTLA